MPTETKQNILLLFDRPQEPVFVAKGHRKAVFNVPQNFLADKYKPIAVEVKNRFGEEADETIPVNNITIPNFGEIFELKRDENFSLFIPKHRRIAGKLIDIFLGVRNTDDLLSVACYARDRVNPYLFNYALSVALLHREDTRDLQLPSFMRLFPDKYLDSKVIRIAREESSIVPESSRVPIEIPVDYTASDLDPEHKLWYFREDPGLNLHHWHWHLVYPFDGPRVVVDKNRRGEIFYYMHQQIIARYNIERFCNNLKRVQRFSDFRQPIPEAYFPKLDSLVASRTYPGRVANQLLSSVNRETDQIRIELADMVRWRDRIYDAIHSGSVRNEDGSTTVLTEFEGIDILGNIVEATILSPNRTYYGDYHNFGHISISYVHDPDNRHLESFGTVGDLATSMRDPVFYNFHAHIDDIFQEFKSTLPSYPESQLNYPGITVTGIEVQPEGNGPTNLVNTYWQQSDVDMSRGLDFQPRGSIFIRFTHLQHQEFTYKIGVNNTSNGNKMGTCRIFIAPKFDERSNPWLFRDQRLLFIELDRFTVSLRQGQNTITRHSTESNLTVPWERTFRDLDDGRPTGGDALEEFNYCICGWPQYLLLPKGKPEGYPCQLFVMISNYDDDRVDQTIEGRCNDAFMFCGLKDKLYPDRRSMGYPFDRVARQGVDTLQEFLTTNMRVQDMVIKFNNQTVRPRGQMATTGTGNRGQ